MNLGIERRIPTCAGTEIKHLCVSIWFSTQPVRDTTLRRNARTFSNNVLEPASYSYSGRAYVLLLTKQRLDRTGFHRCESQYLNFLL